MAPSQLKQLKASLRENGVLGPQKSKKQKKATSKDAQKRIQRNAALEVIRERFNPFEVKAPARRDKFEVASNKVSKPAIGRPGVTRGLGEERRRETLLKEMQSRNRVGALLDRRFGENDPTMTPEQRAAERFARQSERKLRKTSMFNLEDDSEEEMTLTHGGRSLAALGGDVQDDFDEEDVALSDGVDGDEFEAQDDRPSKRVRLLEEEDGGVAVEDGDEAAPQRKKSKNEVMKEIIAKSKMYKAERQAAKEDDDDLRAELDKGMSEFYQALRGHKAPEKKQLPSPPPVTDSEPHMDPSRAAMLAGKSRQDAEKEYETNLRQLKLDARSKPSVRTKTEEEKAAEEAARLEELERKRIRRMKGEAESSEDEDEDDEEEEDAELGPDEDWEADDAEAFGLSAPETVLRKELDVEDEDEFLLEDDLIASDSEAEMASDEDGSRESESEEEEPEDDGDDDFINGLVLPKEPNSSRSKSSEKPSASNDSGTLAYTFPCPQTHQELLDVVKETATADLPTVVQRIRALYHKGLASGNQDKLDAFAKVLTQHVAYLADHDGDVPFAVLESLLRHLHSMAKASPQVVGGAFRGRLEEMALERPLRLSPGDLIILTGISTIFPTSDHFHPVVTPAMLILGRYLGQSPIQSHHDLGVGAYCCSLALRYQRLARRYVPEVITYIVNTLAALAPVPWPENQDETFLGVSVRRPTKSLRIKSATTAKAPAKLSFKDLVVKQADQADNATSLALLHTSIGLSTQTAELWKQKSAFPELVSPLIQVLEHVASQPAHLPKQTTALASAARANLEKLRENAIASRKPLFLHNHRPLAIKTSIPAFIENYNPDRHYDPDRERAELAKLKAEHRKERKGAMRELRKDANFMAREQLREKKEKDAAYDTKFKRLVAEIQGEEGKEKKQYEKEKRKRQGRF
jgi:nucleolar protein 14